MKYLITIFLFSALLFSCSNKDNTPKTGHEGHDHMSASKEMASEERVIYYTCPMESHKHIHSAEPGNCSECGMALVEGVITSEDKMEYYGCPMKIHSHIRHDKPGTCEACKMELKPMRLKKSTS